MRWLLAKAAKSPTEKKRLAVLAFSGGLDTSFCVPWLRERGWDVVTLRAAQGTRIGATEQTRRADTLDTNRVRRHGSLSLPWVFTEG